VRTLNVLAVKRPLRRLGLIKKPKKNLKNILIGK